MSINRDYLGLIDRLARVLPPVDIVGLHLPAPVDDGSFRDEFGFVFLADGSIGPFYVSLPGVLRELWVRYPRPRDTRLEPVATARGLGSRSLCQRALALGAYNALSRRLMRLAGYAPPNRGRVKERVTRPDVPVGMVGYFCPVVDRLVAAGSRVLVLEQQPERVPERTGVSCTTRPADLSRCDQVLCTASVLINDSLDALLEACAGTGSFHLIGPSGSGLPDALFARGVDAVGGILFEDRSLLMSVLARGESWGCAGRKMQIDRVGYPGVEQLVQRMGASPP